MPFVLGLIWAMLWTPLALALELEGRFVVGQGASQVTVLGTSDFARIQPVFSGFVAKTGVSVEYWQASSRDIDQAVRVGLSSEIDVVMSSAVDLQVKLVNDGFAQPMRLEGLAVGHWRSQLVQVAVEPIVTAYHAGVADIMAGVRTRSDLARALRRHPDENWRLATYDPALSGVGYLLAQQDVQQDARFWNLLTEFQRTALLESCCSGEMIDAVIAGERQLAYNVIESYVLSRLEHAPELRILRFEDYQLAIPRTAFVPMTADHPETGAELIRYFVSDEGQSGLSPVIRLSVLEAGGRRGGPLKPIRLSPALIVHLDPVVKADFFERWQRSAP